MKQFFSPTCPCMLCVVCDTFRAETRKAIKQFLLFFIVQFILYALIAWNYRALSNIWPASAFTTDIAIGFINFKVIKRITQSHDHGPALWGYVLGGAFGAQAAMYGSLWVFGK